MRRLLSKLKNSPTTVLISFSTLLLTTGKAVTANEAIQTIQLLENPNNNVKTVSSKSQKACIRHTKLKKFFCANAQ